MSFLSLSDTLLVVTGVLSVTSVEGGKASQDDATLSIAFGLQRGDVVKEVLPKAFQCVKKQQKYRDFRKLCALFAFHAYCSGRSGLCTARRENVLNGHLQVGR
jgi:hypothetical protein